MRNAQQGFSALLLLILVLAFIAVPAYYWYSNNTKSLGPASDVQGASAVKNTLASSGFNVSIISNSATWDLVEYLCKTEEECLNSLNSGRRLGTVSGGETDLHEVVVEYSPEWDDYDFIKYFVRSGWYSGGRLFKVRDLGDMPGSVVKQVEDSGDTYDVVLSPISGIKSNFYNSATFSNL